MRDDLYRMSIFAQVVQSGSFTSAANVLKTSKATVSRHISQLEKQLGTILLQRTTRRLTLTEAGHQFAQRCDELNMLAKQANDEIQNLTSKPSGTLVITAPHALAESYVVPALCDFMKENSGIRPTLIFDDSRLDLIDRHIDIAISVGELPNSSHRAVRLGSLQNHLVASPVFLKRHGTPRTLAALTSFDYVTNNWEPPVLTLHDETGSAVSVKVSPRIRCNTTRESLSFILRGMGIGRIPSPIVNEYIHSAQLAYVLDEYTVPLRPVYMVHAYQGNPPLKVTAFTPFLRNYFDEHEQE